MFDDLNSHTDKFIEQFVDRPTIQTFLIQQSLNRRSSSDILFDTEIWLICSQDAKAKADKEKQDIDAKYDAIIKKINDTREQKIKWAFGDMLRCLFDLRQYMGPEVTVDHWGGGPATRHTRPCIGNYFDEKRRINEAADKEIAWWEEQRKAQKDSVDRQLRRDLENCSSPKPPADTVPR